MKLETKETFKITYYAEKHGKHITRTGKWTAQCRVVDIQSRSKIIYIL
jgi:hypothetical protein